MADFLTQSIHPPPSSPPAAVKEAHKHIPSPLAASTTAGDDDSSVLTTSTNGEAAHQATATAFSQLRTSQGAEGERQIDAPNVKKGDWRTWGKVEARVLVWQDGALRKSKKTIEQPKEEWVMDGALWVTADKQLVFILDRTGSPRCVALEKEPAAPARRLSLFGGTSNSRKSFSAASGAPAAGFASAVGVPSAQAAGDSAVVDEEEPAGAQAPGSPSANESSGGVKGFVKSVKNVFKKSDDTEAQDGAEGDNKLSLSRTKTNEREKNLKLERTRSTSEPLLGAPFPSYKGFPISALHIADPASVLTVRYFRTRGTSTPFWAPAQSAPLSSPNNLEDHPKPLGGVKVDADTLPPCVEIDVAPRADRRKARKTGGGDEGEQREVTIGFNFLETMLWKEAEEFREHMDAFMTVSPAPAAADATSATVPALENVPVAMA